MECGTCQKSCASAKSSTVLCEQCRNTHHCECAGVSLEIRKALRTVGGLIWRCVDCRFDLPKPVITEEMMSAKIKECTELFHAEVQVMTEDLSNKLLKMDSACKENIKELNLNFMHKFEELNVSSAPGVQLVTPTETLKQSYAKATSAASKSRVLVQPKDPNQELSKTKLDVLNKVDPVGKKISVKGVRNMKGGGLIVACASTEERKLLMDIAEQNLADDYIVKELNCVLPSVRIAGISHNFSKECIENYLRSQNSGLFVADSVCEVIKIEPSKKNADKYFAEIKVDPQLYRKLLDARHVLVGMDPCAVYDSFEITRCFTCNEFNHTSARCVSKKQTCPLCSKDHKLQECTIKAGQNQNMLCCSNCSSFNNRNNTSLPTNHTVWNYNQCQSYQSVLSKFKHDLFGFPIEQ